MIGIFGIPEDVLYQVTLEASYLPFLAMRQERIGELDKLKTA